AGVSLDRLNAFRSKHYSAANATLIVVGDFELAKAEKMVRSVFAGWGAGYKDEPIARDPRPRTGPVYAGVAGDDNDPQVTVEIAYPAPAGIDGQEGARMVLAEMLNARMGDIRFKLGATYGTYAGRRPQ